jgi:hypothetical protein
LNLAVWRIQLDAQPGGFMAFETGLTLSERFASLFQPDTLIPQEYLETFKRRTHLQPEKRLMLAVLEDGIACFQKYVAACDTKGKKYFQETEQWVMEEPNERLFSFNNVCETLGLDADYLRRGLMCWKTAALEKRATGRIYHLAPQLEEDQRAPLPERRTRRAFGR